MNNNWPIIKENRLEKLRGCLDCISAYSFDRNRQRNCILQLYPGKSEKSVFRGMVIPSLRHLGWILGHARQLRISANGVLIMGSQSIGNGFQSRCISAVIYDLDSTRFGLLEYLTERKQSEISSIIDELSNNNNNLKASQIKERVVSWVALLNQAHLVDTSRETVVVNRKILGGAIDDLDFSRLNIDHFKATLFVEYNRLAKESAGIVDITDLRVAVTSSFCNDERIITESLFDYGLSKIPFVSEDYLISLGRPMGGEEKLFRYKDGYYRTINIRMMRGK